MTFFALDATAQKVGFSTTTDAQGNQVGSSCETDPITGVKKQVGTQYNSDGQNFTSGSGLETALCMDYNGTGFDRRRNNVDFTSSAVVVNGASAQTLNGPAQTNFNHKGVQLGLNVTQISASTSITFTIQGQDAVSGAWYSILSSAAISTVSFARLTVYPGVTTAANAAANDVLPRTWRVVATISGPGTATATVGASVIV